MSNDLKIVVNPKKEKLDFFGKCSIVKYILSLLGQIVSLLGKTNCPGLRTLCPKRLLRYCWKYMNTSFFTDLKFTETTRKSKGITIILPAPPDFYYERRRSTNIDINHCIDRISLFLPTIFEDEHECKGIIEALDIVMHNNRMRFGDLIFHQIRGVAMGMSPAPTIANLYVASTFTGDLLTTASSSGYTTTIPS